MDTNSKVRYKELIDRMFQDDFDFNEFAKRDECDNAKFMAALIDDAFLSNYVHRKIRFEKLRIYIEYLKYIPNVVLKLISLINVEDEDPKTIRNICTDYLNLYKQFSDFFYQTGNAEENITESKLIDESIQIKPSTASKMLALLAKDAKKKQTRISNLRFETDDATKKEKEKPTQKNKHPP